MIRYLAWSYNAVPTGGKLTITNAGATVMEIDITAAGPGALAPEYPGGLGASVVVTLAAGGSNVTGKINVYSYTVRG